MKTRTQLPALLLILAVLFATNTFASNKSIDFEEEAYIDDIPFITEWVVSELMTLSIDFEEEAYVDDIPFNTKAVVENHTMKKAMETDYDMAEEAYVDDIPMDTRWIAGEVAARNFHFEEEADVNDIPFNTEAIACHALAEGSETALNE